MVEIITSMCFECFYFVGTAYMKTVGWQFTFQWEKAIVYTIKAQTKNTNGTWSIEKSQHLMWEGFK